MAADLAQRNALSRSNPIELSSSEEDEAGEVKEKEPGENQKNKKLKFFELRASGVDSPVGLGLS